MKQKLTDTNYQVSRGGRVEDYWMTRVMHPHYAQEEAKQQEVDMVAILKEYKLKGFEFGNWVNQNDRYDFIHAFTRSAQILSEIIGSKNIGLDLLVGVAFGARGHGGGAVAHYEPMHNMINLTKEKSYGSLAHEWGHAIDYNLGRHIDQNKDYSFLTGGHSVAAILPTNTGAQLRMWANAVVDEAKATPSYKRIEKADEYWHRRTEVWARFMEQYVAYQCKLKKKSPRYLALTFEEYTKMTAYWTEADFVKIARGSMFSFMAVLKGVLNNRYNLTASPYKYKTRDMLYPKPGKAPKPKYTLPLYVVLKGRKPTDSNMLKFDKTEIKDGKVYYIGRSVDATPKEAYRHTPEEKILADYDRVPRLTAEKAIREKWNSGTHQKAAKRAASKPATGKNGVDKLEVRRQLIKLGVIEGSGQSVHFTPKLKELIKLYPGHKQEVLEVACNMWAGDTIRRRGGGIVEHYKEEAIKEARRVLASRKSTETSKPATGKKKEPTEAKPAKAPAIKPLGGFVLTKTGKLCTDEKTVSKWGSDNLKTWKRIYVVRLYDDDKTASIYGHFVICLKNGQYYFGDMWGQSAIELDKTVPDHWETYIHPAGSKKPVVRRVGLNYSDYSFRDRNEAVYFAEHTHKRKVQSYTQGVDSKAFHMLLKDIYEFEYMFAEYPSRRGTKSMFWKNEKPQKVDTITKNN